jgi:hypothetical protein
MIDDSILPMRSYRDPIVAAARANGLPAEYVDGLARTPVADNVGSVYASVLSRGQRSRCLP